MDQYSFSLVRQYDSDEYCQTVRVRLAAEDIHAVVEAFVEFLESAGFQSGSISGALASARRS